MRPLRFAGGVLLYLGFAFVSPVALVALPLGLLFLLQRPSRRETLVAAGLLGLTLWGLASAVPGFELVEGAWVLLLSGGLALALMWLPPERDGVVATCLLAVGIAGFAAAFLVGATAMSWREVLWLAERHFSAQTRMVMGAMANMLGGQAEATRLLVSLEAAADSTVRTVSRLLPGLVLLQSVAALAIAWVLYRLVARHPTGAPLPALRDFRFNDHLIWGVVLALLALVLPGLGSLRLLGGNLATFFGGLYVVRGVAVVVAMAAAGGIGGPLVTIAGVLVAVVLLPIVAFTALALGVSDTWVDWRRLARAAKRG